jgi:hypothetical protein
VKNVVRVGDQSFVRDFGDHGWSTVWYGLGSVCSGRRRAVPDHGWLYPGIERIGWAGFAGGFGGRGQAAAGGGDADR